MSLSRLPHAFVGAPASHKRPSGCISLCRDASHADGQPGARWQVGAVLCRSRTQRQITAAIVVCGLCVPTCMHEAHIPDRAVLPRLAGSWRSTGT